MSVRRNIDAAVWFAEDIFPQIRMQITDAELWIVGSDPSQKISELNSLPGIHVTGTVENIKDYYLQGKVFIAPYHFGAGTRLKVLEAMASGIPVVSTSIGCRGIEVFDKEHLLIANGEKEFSECVIKLLKDEKLAEMLAKNAADLMKNKYSWKKIANDLEKIFVQKYEF